MNLKIFQEYTYDVHDVFPAIGDLKLRHWAVEAVARWSSLHLAEDGLLQPLENHIRSRRLETQATKRFFDPLLSK